LRKLSRKEAAGEKVSFPPNVHTVERLKGNKYQSTENNVVSESRCIHNKEGKGEKVHKEEITIALVRSSQRAESGP